MRRQSYAHVDEGLPRQALLANYCNRYRIDRPRTHQFTKGSADGAIASLEHLKFVDNRAGASAGQGLVEVLTVL